MEGHLYTKVLPCKALQASFNSCSEGGCERRPVYIDERRWYSGMFQHVGSGF
uniref:Uncharacterized protein n=1 Tax=Picea sitchensis TaxID=3332 RepID=A9NZV7_PICSI|nr:unknown [Picea sitchensis]